jgi:phenylacetyl-CoA:acceptor oxidoreductase subunit 2
MTYGPAPWRQRSWDWRAAANFVGGGAGSGLIICTALAAPSDAPQAALFLAGTALIGLGLFCVWLEIGRPVRALNVFLNPFTSWMSREAFTATLLIPAGLLAALGFAGTSWIAAAFAVVFVYCQGRMLRAAKGIPAWRDPATPPLIVVTGLTEGAGLLVAVLAWMHGAAAAASLAFAALLVVRAALWWAWRNNVRTHAAPRALAAIDRTGRWLLLAGTAAPLVALVPALATQGNAAAWLPAVAGLLAAGTGALFKFDLLGGAAFNQGFALSHLPVRGVRR